MNRDKPVTSAWAQAAAATWTREFGAERSTTKLVVQALSHARADNTDKAYGSMWTSFVKFCREQHVRPLLATPKTSVTTSLG